MFIAILPYAVGVVIVAIIIAVNVWQYRTRQENSRQQRKIAELRERIELALTGDLEVLAELFPTDNETYALARSGKLGLKLEELSSYNANRAEITKLYREWRLARGLENTLSCAMSLTYKLEMLSCGSLDQIGLRLMTDELRITVPQIGELMRIQFNEAFLLTAQVHPPDVMERRAATRLRLVRSHIPWEAWGFRHRDIKYPENWNELVAAWIINPQYDHFLTTESFERLLLGDVRLWAAEACDNRELTKAKLIVAMCEAKPEVKAEVGDGLLRDLAYCIVRDPVQQKLIGSTQEAPA